MGSQILVNGRDLSNVVVLVVLGMQVQSLLKMVTQVDRTVQKAFGVLAFIGQVIESKKWDVMMQLKKTLVRLYRVVCVVLVTTGRMR